MTAKPQQGKTKPAKLSAPKKPLSVSKPLSVPQKRVQSSTTQPLDGGVKRAKTQAVLSRETTDSADLSCLADELAVNVSEGLHLLAPADLKNADDGAVGVTDSHAHGGPELHVLSDHPALEVGAIDVVIEPRILGRHSTHDDLAVG